MYRSDEQLFDIIGCIRERKHGSKAAAVAVVTPCQMMVANNPNRNKSKAASVSSENKVKVIYDFLNSKQY